MLTSRSDCAEATEETRTCVECGRVLPVVEFGQHGYRCKECLKERNMRWATTSRERIEELKWTYRRNAPCKAYPVMPSSNYSPPAPDIPIPSLQIGKTYRITEPAQDEECDEVYVGKCVARYGINWAIETTNGIRCFTQGQLVGLKIEEVECLA